jgi:hypothetical protein
LLILFIKSINDWTKEYNNLLSFALNGQLNYTMIDELIKIPNKPNKYYLSEWNNFPSDLLAWNDFLGINIEINTNVKKEISGSEINADKNLSNLINTDHYKKIIKYVPTIKSSYNNWSIDLSDIIRYLNDKFKPLKCKISTIDFVADHNKKINSLFIKCNIISNDPFALIADYPIIINNLCKMSYDPELLNDVLFNNKLKSELKFTRSKSEYIKYFANIIKMLMDVISENIEM